MKQRTTTLLGLLLGLPLALGLSLLASCASQPTARKVIDRYLDVSGTRDLQYESVHTRGTIELVGMGVEGTTETWQKRPDRIATVVEMSLIGKVRSGYDGEVAWRIHPMLGEAILEGAELEQLLRRGTSFRFPFKDPADYEVIELLGEVDFADQRCRKIRYVETPYAGLDPAASLPLREFFEYYSVDTGLLVGTEGVAASPQGDIPSTTVLSDYEPRGGSLVPLTTRIEAAGVTIEAKTTTIEYDGVDPAVFALPAEIQVLRKAQAAPATAEG